MWRTTFKKYKRDSFSYRDSWTRIRFQIMVFATLLTTVLLALSVAANPVVVERSLVKLPLSRHINVTASIQNVLQHDQLRAKNLRTQGQARAAGIERDVISSQVDNQVQSYIASIGVGSPATQCK